MNWLWFPLAFALGWAACWYLTGRIMKLFFKRSLLVDAIKGLRTETVVRLKEEAEAEIARRKHILAEKARA